MHYRLPLPIVFSPHALSTPTLGFRASNNTDCIVLRERKKLNAYEKRKDTSKRKKADWIFLVSFPLRRKPRIVATAAYSDYMHIKP